MSLHTVRTRTLLRRELLGWGSLSVALGAVEGGVAGVVVKSAFEPHLAPALASAVLALATGAPAFANLLSVWFARASLGRDKKRLLLYLNLMFIGCVALVGLLPMSAYGAMALVVLLIGCRAAWSAGIVLRATLWRANYGRDVRARVTGYVGALSALIIACSGYLIGRVLEWRPEGLHWVYPAAALVGLTGALWQRKMPLRHRRRLLAAESGARQAGSVLRQSFRLLRADPDFRRYMSAMMVFGSGNLMMVAPLILVMDEQLRLGAGIQILIAASVPQLLIAATTRWWAGLLDRHHILRYRVLHSWVTALGFVCFALGAIFLETWLMWPGAVLYGAGVGAGILGWNLGHNDFAGDDQASLYMGVHASLTGLRGLLVPFIGVAFYRWLEAMQPGLGRWALCLPLALTTSGVFWFYILDRRRG